MEEGENTVKKFLAFSLAAAGLFVSAGLASAQTVVGVSWNNFQEERWKTDEAAIKGVLDAAGAKYISADAQSSAEKQKTDIEQLISQGATVLIVLAQDSAAIAGTVDDAVAKGIPVIGYDRLIENPKAFYITFDNKQVGVMQAQAVFAALLRSQSWRLTKPLRWLRRGITGTSLVLTGAYVPCYRIAV